MTAADMLRLLEDWRAAGWLRSLDLAFARFITERDGDAPASLVLAAALVAHLEGRGHSGLPCAQLASDAEALLAWPPEGLQALRQALVGWQPGSAALQAEWSARPVVQANPADDSGATPLVLRGGLLYLRRYWRCESRVATQVHARAAAHEHARAAAQEGSRAAAQERTRPQPGTEADALLDQLFGPAPPGADTTDTDWQRQACSVALQARLSIITGGPGTGKTYTAARLLVLLQALRPGPQPLRVALAAPTGKAAARLRQSIQKALHGLQQQLAPGLLDWAQQLDPARTLHALLGTQPGTRHFRHDAANPLEVDVLIVDEASMVHLEMMAQLLEAVPTSARVVLLGDQDQLASVEAGAVLGDLCQSTALKAQTVVLQKSHRFDGPIGQLALAVNRGDAATAAGLLRADPQGPVAALPSPAAAAVWPVALRGRPGAEGGYGVYLQLLSQRPADASAFDRWARSVLQAFDGFRVLTALRDGPWGVTGLNQAIERALADAGLLARRGEWYEGRPVMVTRNDAALGVFNGDVGIVLRPPAAAAAAGRPGADAALRCYFLEGEDLRSVAVGRLADVETAFAMTVHKSQGSEFGHVLLAVPEEDTPVLTREWLYTGITRASRALTWAGPLNPALALATARQTRRVSGLRDLLGPAAG